MAATATREEIEGRVFSALEEFGAEPDQINPDATFESLDIDSLDLVELGQIAEEEFGVRIEPSDMKEMKTVGDAIDFVAARVA